MAATPQTDPVAYQRAVDKYKELYAYSTDVLLKEHERFNRADDKAAKYSAIFVFLIGAVAFFDKAAIDGMLPPRGPIEWFIAALAILGLLVSIWGWHTSNLVIRSHPYVSRRLDQQMIDFFRNEPVLNIYYGLARENMNAYQENLKYSEAKYKLLIRAASMVTGSVSILVLLAILYGIDRYLMASSTGPLM